MSRRGKKRITGPARFGNLGFALRALLARAYRLRFRLRIWQWFTSLANEQLLFRVFKEYLG